MHSKVEQYIPLLTCFVYQLRQTDEQVIATQCANVCKRGFPFFFVNSSIVACRGGSVAGVPTAIQPRVEPSGRLNFPSSPNIFLPTVPAPLMHLIRPCFRVSNTLSASVSIHVKQLKIALVYTKNRSKTTRNNGGCVCCCERQTGHVGPTCLFVGYKPAMTREDLRGCSPSIFCHSGHPVKRG